MNPYYETLKDELREECGEDICQADWDCFWSCLNIIDDMSVNSSSAILSMREDVRDKITTEEAIDLSSYAQGTRADLPSIVKYAYAAIEENLK